MIDQWESCLFELATVRLFGSVQSKHCVRGLGLELTKPEPLEAEGLSSPLVNSL